MTEQYKTEYLAAFDYVSFAQTIANVLPKLAQFDTVENAKKSAAMREALALFGTCGTQDFLISVAVALSFNVSPDAPDRTLNDMTDTYLEGHPELKKKMTAVVEHIESLSDDSELMDP